LQRAVVGTLAFAAPIAQASVAGGPPRAMPVNYSNHASTATPALHSSAALVFDATHSSVLYARHSDVAVPSASITKLLTALGILDAGQPLDEVLEITAEDRNHGRARVSRLVPGAQLTRGDLLHLALMASENRATHALARHYPGGLNECVRAMNAKAQALGMTTARFVEPTGLSDANVASPEDLAKLVMAAAQVAAIREYSTDGDYTVKVGRHTVHYVNTDSLVRKPDWNIVVQKTGYIAQSGQCLVMQTVIEDRTLVIVLMHSFGKRTRVADARRIRRWVESTLPTHDAASAATT